jgi:hypothetical protein
MFMTIIEFGAIGEFIGAIAVVVTLIYLAVQMRQNTNALKLNSARSVTEELQDMLALVASNQELSEILVAAAGGSELQGAQRVRYYTYTHNLVRVYENAFLQLQSGVIDQAHWEGMTRMMIDFTSGAGFQSYWLNRKHWVSDEFQEYMDTNVISVLPKAGVDLAEAV